MEIMRKYELSHRERDGGWGGQREGTFAEQPSVKQQLSGATCSKPQQIYSLRPSGTGGSLRSGGLEKSGCVHTHTITHMRRIHPKCYLENL